MDSIEFSGLLPPGHGRQYRVNWFSFDSWISVIVSEIVYSLKGPSVMSNNGTKCVREES